MSKAQETHRPGPLKQQNKAHKAVKHNTKRSKNTDQKGGVWCIILIYCTLSLIEVLIMSNSSIIIISSVYCRSRSIDCCWKEMPKTFN